MELMSSLLLYALVAYFPEAIGYNESPEDIQVRHNPRVFHQQKPQRKKILLNLHGPPLVNIVSDLQYVFMDVGCKKCINCMERAIKAYRKYSEVVKKRPLAVELEEDILKHKNVFKHRTKRNAFEPVKKIKPKKRSNKSVTITKYNVDGEVYGLRVKEMHANNVKTDQLDNKISTCHIYSVKNSFECDSPESEMFLVSAKKKVNSKRSKKIKDKEKVDVTLKANSTDVTHPMPSFKKRHVDQGRGDSLENFEPSIEDIMSY